MSQTPNNPTVDDGDPTQLATPCSKHEHIVDCINHSHDCDVKCVGGELDIPILQHQSIDETFSEKQTSITWKASGGQMNSIDRLRFQISYDTDENTAIFKLSSKVNTKFRSQSVPIYLFIQPHHIDNIQLETLEQKSSLRFVLKRGPLFITPADNLPFEPKENSKSKVDLMQNLSAAQDFSVHVISNRKDGDDSIEQCLRQVASIFSRNNPNRPQTDSKHDPTAGLYCGRGGYVSNKDTISKRPFIATGELPSYEQSVSGTRKRKRQRKISQTDVEHDRSVKECSLVPASNIKKYILSIVEECMKPYGSRLDALESRLGDLEATVECDFDPYASKLDTRVEAAPRSRLQSLEDRVSRLTTERGSGRCSSEELDTRVDKALNSRTDDMRTELHSHVDDKFKDLKCEVCELQERVNEAGKQLGQIEAGEDILAEKVVEMLKANLPLQITSTITLSDLGAER